MEHRHLTQRELDKLEQEAVEQKQDDLRARDTVEEALSRSLPQERYHQMQDQQDMNQE